MKTPPSTAAAPLVGIIMGSDSDWPTMQAAAAACAEFAVPHEVRVVSAHRTPDDMARYARTAHQRVIAGAANQHIGAVGTDQHFDILDDITHGIAANAGGNPVEIGGNRR